MTNPKVSRALLPLLGLLATALPVAADVERRSASDFHQRALVEGELYPGEAHALPLSSEAVSALAAGGELRLFDADGRELPSLVETANYRREVTERPAVVFNRAWADDGTQTVSIELTDRTAQSANPSVNEFVVTINEEQYHLLVRVEGSDDGAAWKVVGEKLNLIRHVVEREAIDYVHDVLRIPSARFRYYRFTFTPRSAPVDESRPLEISSVKVREVVERGSSLDIPTRIERFDNPRDADARHHYWKLGLPHARLGVERVRLTIPADNYARGATLWEWNEERERTTRRLATTVVFQYGDDIHTELGGFSTKSSRLVVMLDQGDDEPVSVTAALASRPLRQLRFLAPETVRAPLALYFRPDHAREPRYDLARLLQEQEISNFHELRHTSLRVNTDYHEPSEPRSERVPYLLYLLVVPLVAALVAYVARTITRGMPDGTPPTDS